MENIYAFVQRLSHSVACYFHFNHKSKSYSLKRYDLNERCRRMNVFGWVQELKGRNSFRVSTYKWLGDKADVTHLADEVKEGANFISKDRDPDGKGTGIFFYVEKGSNGKDYEKAVRALKAILCIM